MFLLEVITGVLGGLIFLAAIVLMYRVHQKFEEDRELASTKIFLEGSMVRSLKVVAAGSIFLGLTGLISIIAILFGLHEIYKNFFRIGTAIVFLSYFYMNFEVYMATK